jgi:hypothetical protein
MTVNEAEIDACTAAAEGDWDLVANLESTTLDDGDASKDESTTKNESQKREAHLRHHILIKTRRFLRCQVNGINLQLKEELAEKEKNAEGPTSKISNLRQSRRMLKCQLQAVNRQLRKERPHKRCDTIAPSPELVELRKTRRLMKCNWTATQRRLTQEWQQMRRSAMKDLRETKRAFTQKRKQFLQERRALHQAWLSQKLAVNNEIRAITDQ